MDVKDKEGKVYGQCFVSLYTYVLTQQYAPNDRECMPLANGIVGELHIIMCACVCVVCTTHNIEAMKPHFHCGWNQFQFNKDQKCLYCFGELACTATT